MIDSSRTATCVLALLTGIALSACTALSGTAPDNPEPAVDRWLSFMRGHGHDIDRHALRIREDGLVESATRYPRTSSAGWTEDQHRRGSYEYIERVIDCETGLHVDTRLSLLDRSNLVVATRRVPRDDQLQQLALRQSDVARHSWPDSSEILLACIAAAHPRASAEELRELSSELPDLRREPLFDFALLQYSPPSDGYSLFARLRGQYDAWRRKFVPAPTPAAEARTHPLKPAEQSDRWLEAEGRRIDIANPEFLGNGSIAIIEDVHDSLGWRDWSPPQLPEQFDLRQVIALDCRNGLAIPVERLFYDPDDGRLLRRDSTHVINTMGNAPRSIAWTQWHGPRGSLYGMVCRTIARRCGATTQSAQFEITPGVLKGKRDADMLRAAHDTWLAHRAGFVPACVAGDDR